MRMVVHSGFFAEQRNLKGEETMVVAYAYFSFPLKDHPLRITSSVLAVLAPILI